MPANQVRIAVLEEQIRGIREQQRCQHATAQRRFDEIEDKVDALMAVFNRGRCVYAASLMFAGLAGSIFIKLAEMTAHLFQR